MLRQLIRRSRPAGVHPSRRLKLCYGLRSVHSAKAVSCFDLSPSQSPARARLSAYKNKLSRAKRLARSVESDWLEDSQCDLFPIFTSNLSAAENDSTRRVEHDASPRYQHHQHQNHRSCP